MACFGAVTSLWACKVLVDCKCTGSMSANEQGRGWFGYWHLRWWEGVPQGGHVARVSSKGKKKGMLCGLPRPCSLGIRTIIVVVGGGFGVAVRKNECHYGAQECERIRAAMQCETV